MAAVVEVKNLHREFVVTEGIFKRKKRKVQALEDINLQVEKGEIFGLLGPNGAGKTTLIKILTTLLYPSEGEAKVFNHNVVQEAPDIRSRINFIFGGERALYWRLSAEDNLKYFADLYKIDEEVQKERIPQLLKLVGLQDRAQSKVETFSKGMKQRLHIARGLINDPEVLFLDEPTIGLDPEASQMIRKLVQDLKALGKTIFLTTHYMLEADLLCDRIGIINKGKIIAMDSPQGLKELTHGWSTLELRVFGINQGHLEVIRQIPGVEFVHTYDLEQNQMLRIQTRSPEEIFSQVLARLEKDQVRVLNATQREASLEDSYLKLIGGVA